MECRFIQGALSREAILDVGFVKTCGTTDSILAAWLPMEKHREKHRVLYIAFVNLEKAFDHVPHKVNWCALL